MTAKRALWSGKVFNYLIFVLNEYLKKNCVEALRAKLTKLRVFLLPVLGIFFINVQHFKAFSLQLTF